MKNFVLVNIRDERKIKKHQKDDSLKPSVILPYFCEGYACFSSNKAYSFDELIHLFLHGNEDEIIGAISIIAERYPHELYKHICHHADCFAPEKLKFLFDYVVPSYLPLLLPKERLPNYVFDEEFTSDIWVNILVAIRSLL